MEAATAQHTTSPTAFGDDVRHFVNLTFTLAVTEWKLRFFGSVLGYLWTLMRPLLLFSVLYIVFTHVVKVGGKIPHYPVYLLESIVLFQFFADSTSQGLQSLLQRESLLRKMRFPRMVIPLSVVLTNLFNLGMNGLAVLVFVLVNGIQPRWTWLLVPILGARTHHPRDRRGDAHLRAVRALPRPRADLGDRAADRLLRLADPLRDLDRCPRTSSTRWRPTRSGW